MKWRSLTVCDYIRVYELGLVYPEHLHEDSKSFFSRINAGRDYCFVLGGEICCGYALAHLWSDAIPNLKKPLPDEGVIPTTLYVHDLVIEDEFQRLGCARAQVDAWKRMTPFGSLQLVSVNGSEPFWSAQGFVPLAEQPDLSSYGDGAVALRWAA